jgi:hypothetical protein
MFVRQNQQQFRNSNADVQIFYGDATATTAYQFKKSWNKPTGVSHVYMMMVGGGGPGDGTLGGGSGAVTVWYGAAQNVPNQLEILLCGPGFGITSGIYSRGSTLALLLSAQSTSSSTGAPATAASQFAASGFYQSTAGQAGNNNFVNPSTTTFLSGGAPAATNVTSNYGYQTIVTGAAGFDGFFQLMPIIVGVGGSGSSNGGIGCGGGTTGLGGQGMVLIASW